ncbi:MAG: ferrochelatase, partial [Burkholderiales bacterium]
MHAPAPPFAHDRTPRVGVLLTNLGTPDAPTPAAVRRYLGEFLADPRVVEIPPVVWRLILHGVILRVRPKQSAKKYEAIWTKEGSPLLVHSQRQRTLLRGYLGERLKQAGLPADLCPVELGMRYGEPSIGGAIDRLREAGCERILVLPLFPQYAAST